MIQILISDQITLTHISHPKLTRHWQAD